MINIIARILKILNSESDPGQISLALCLSMIVGLTPLYSLHNLLAVFLVLILRVNLSAFLLGWLFFSAIAYLLDPLFHRIGLNLLTAGVLESLWTTLYNLTLLRLARFNNTIVMGSLLFSLVAFVPLYIFSNFLIIKYRDHVLAWIRNTRMMTAIKASKFYSAYERLSGWGGIT